jgi:lipoate---protein ligase
MILKDISLEQPQDNILYDEVLLEIAQAGQSPEVLRLWESPVYFIVLGRTGKIAEDVKEQQARKDRIPISRRSSGGGTVLQGKGCLNYSLVLDKQKQPGLADIHKSYQIILNKIVAILKTLDVPAAFRPISDLVIESTEQKFSGNAQRRSRNFVLHHGTILYDFDIALIERYLKMPQQIPDYRRKRTHKDFLTNIERDATLIRKAFRDGFMSAEIETRMTEEESRNLNNSRIRANHLTVG